MRRSVFPALVWAASDGLIRLHAAALSGSWQMLQTLRGWAVAALVISAAMSLRRGGKGPEPRAAIAAFGLFSSAIAALMVFAGSGAPIFTAPHWSGTALTLAGGVLLPVIAMMALEFPDLRAGALAGAVVVAAGLLSFGVVSTLILNPGQRLSIIRIKQRPKTKKPVQPAASPERPWAPEASQPGYSL